MNESCCVYERVMSHIWTNHFTHVQLLDYYKTHECVSSRIKRHIARTIRQVSHVWMSHVARMNESCRTYSRVMSHTWTSHVTQVQLLDYYKTHEWVSSCIKRHIARMNTSSLARMNESCRTYEWVTSHVWMSHVTHTSKWCRTYEWGVSHIWMRHVANMNKSWHICAAAVKRMNESLRASKGILQTRIRQVVHVWRSHVAHTSEWCRTYGWVMSCICMSHVAHMNESQRTGAAAALLHNAWVSSFAH